MSEIKEFHQNVIDNCQHKRDNKSIENNKWEWINMNKTIETNMEAMLKNTDEIVSQLMVARKSQGFTQAELCKESTVAQKTISRLENGIEKPNLKTLLKLTNSLGLSIVFEEMK